METRGASDDAVREHGVSPANLGMLLIFESGNGEFGAVVVGRADADRFLRDLRTRLANDFNQAFQPCIGARSGVRNDLDWIVMRLMFLPFRGILRTRRVVRTSRPVRPLERLRKISGIFKYLASVRRPEHDGHHIRGIRQRLPLGEHAAANRIHRCFRVIPERFGAELQRNILQVHMRSPCLITHILYTRNAKSAWTIVRKADFRGKKRNIVQKIFTSELPSSPISPPARRKCRLSPVRRWRGSSGQRGRRTRPFSSSNSFWKRL